MKAGQRGMSFIGFILGAIVLVLVAIGGLKLVPAYIHSAQIAEIFREIAADPAMRGAPAATIEMSFRKRASVNDINDLKPEDIEIEDDNGRLILSAHYTLKVPLVGNASLLLEFNPSSR